MHILVFAINFWRMHFVIYTQYCGVTAYFFCEFSTQEGSKQVVWKDALLCMQLSVAVEAKHTACIVSQLSVIAYFDCERLTNKSVTTS